MQETNVSNLIINNLTKEQYEGIETPSNTELYLVPDEESGNVLRDVGKVVYSFLPLTNAGLHLLDGALIQGDGGYKEFVDYIAALYAENPPEEGYEKDEIVTLPTFSSNTQDGITISDARGNTTSLQAIFNGTNQSNQVGLWNTYWINIDYGQNTIIDSYTIQADNNGSPEYPSAWTFEGSNNGIDWITLDEKTGITFSLNAIKTFPISTTNVYSQYRIVFSNGAHSSNNGELKQFYTTAYTVENVFKNSIFTKESQWQLSVNTYGSCGKFVYDSINNTVRLPKVSDILQGTTDLSALGDLVEAGLPDHNHLINENTFGYKSGAVPANSYTVADTLKATSYYTQLASRSNSIYGNSTTVQPQTIKVFVYIVIANSTKTAIQVNIDRVTTDLNGKADTDLANVTVPYVISRTPNEQDGIVEVWSDGYCVQTGKLVINSASVAAGNYSTKDLTLLVPYTQLTSYYVQAKHDRFNAGFASDVIGKACSSVSVYQVNDSSNSFANPYVVWRTEGYTR